MGDALRKLGNLDSALQVFFKCLEISKRQEAVVSNSVGESLVAIADIYSILGSHQNAIDYYKQAIVNAMFPFYDPLISFLHFNGIPICLKMVVMT